MACNFAGQLAPLYIMTLTPVQRDIGETIFSQVYGDPLSDKTVCLPAKPCTDLFLLYSRFWCIAWTLVLELRLCKRSWHCPSAHGSCISHWEHSSPGWQEQFILLRQPLRCLVQRSTQLWQLFLHLVVAHIVACLLESRHQGLLHRFVMMSATSINKSH